VTIAKAGEIIPQVIEVNRDARSGSEVPFSMPTECPVCGTAVVRRTEEVAIRCPNRRCPAVLKGSIIHYSRRYAMDIDQLGEVLVDQLVDGGLVHDVGDLYDLTSEELAELPRMGKKSAENVVSGIAASKERTLDRLLTGLGIEHIGQVAARQLAEAVVTLEAFASWTPDEAREHVSAIAGFGPKMVEAVVRFLGDETVQTLLRELRDHGVSRAQPVAGEAPTGPLTGASFCVTGVLSRKREDVHKDIHAAGGKIHDSVKKGTTYLVAGEKVGKSKLDAAKKHGVKVIDENALARLIRGESIG